jgi:tetratricopeptide (TPR) repeat protein
MDKVTFFRSYLVDKPDDRFARYSLALELKKAGDREGAVAELRELLRRHPTSGAGHLQLGQIFEEDDEFELAADAFRAGLAALEGHEDAEARKARSELRTALDTVEMYL